LKHAQLAVTDAMADEAFWGDKRACAHTRVRVSNRSSAIGISLATVVFHRGIRASLRVNDANKNHQRQQKRSHVFTKVRTA
jgi:hypothetical protein